MYFDRAADQTSMGLPLYLSIYLFLNYLPSRFQMNFKFASILVRRLGNKDPSQWLGVSRMERPRILNPVHSLPASRPLLSRLGVPQIPKPPLKHRPEMTRCD